MGMAKNTHHQKSMCSWVKPLQLGETTWLTLDNGLWVEVMGVTSMCKNLRPSEQHSFNFPSTIMIEGEAHSRGVAKDGGTLGPCVMVWSRGLCYLPLQRVMYSGWGIPLFSFTISPEN